ncbi:hypothetical protein KOW79_013481 [Hemibagrus wyckioides]|uniref:Cadherin domain-containing protein n=1 Tax=Hemibagrus wyckioides TaxID=337641 RepID=A0A9D3SLM8_9TELE|nr:cadherin-like protein 26 [Hemibagrus wyckioides]KAG7323779.1 hypothetical protein KOW79_013481 [Hemibagrus wyckioides]
MRTIITMMIILSMTCVVEVSGQSKIRRKRTWIIDSFSIEEENPGPYPYVLGTINVEREYLVFFFITGRGIDKDPENVLSINSRTGEVLVHKKVDYEAYKNLSFTFEARNNLFAVDTKLGVEIKILDINDNAPVFNSSLYETTLDESAPQGILVTTVAASDLDDPNTPNGTFKFTIASVTPKTDNVEFYIQQNNNTGSIYFKGCLDYEKAPKYTLLIKATDNGNKVQQSSTSTVVLNIIDKNNNLPRITNHTGPARIKERETGVEVLRLQVSDKDSIGSPAWKAKFILHGDPENYFKIQTDPKTNEGILTVVKIVDYEDKMSRNLSINVENEVPNFSCRVKTRTSRGLWDVETDPKEFNVPYNVTINIEDVNDPPEFVTPIKEIWIAENTKIGTLLETFSVIDPDKKFESKFQFNKTEDKNNWVTVNQETGQVFVNKVMDRERLNDGAYRVIVHAVSKDRTQTGTGTLLIHLKDVNDNVPLLVNNTVEMCESHKNTNIAANDADQMPNSGPFQWVLEDDQTEGKWKIVPISGITARLDKQDTVHEGIYEIRIKISDNQGHGSVQTLSVKVRDCTKEHMGYFTVQLSFSAIWIVIFALLLLPGALLMTLQFCKKQKNAMILHDDFPGHLIKSNIEMPGTDCEIPLHISQLLMSQSKVKMSNGSSKQLSMLHNGLHGSSATSVENQMFGNFHLRPSIGHPYQKVTNDDMTVSMSKNCTNHIKDFPINTILSNQLNQRLLLLQTSEQEHSDYKPHSYAYEEEPDKIPVEHLDTLSIPETNFNLDILTNLNVRFTSLAAVCRPDLMSPT